MSTIRIAAAELEEVRWIDPRETAQLELAPLTRNYLLPSLLK